MRQGWLVPFRPSRCGLKLVTHLPKLLAARYLPVGRFAEGQPRARETPAGAPGRSRRGKVAGYSGTSGPSLT